MERPTLLLLYKRKMSVFFAVSEQEISNCFARLQNGAQFLNETVRKRPVDLVWFIH